MDVDVAAAAGLFADSTRAGVVAALLDGRALTAGELARRTGVSAQTVSAHLGRLRSAGILAVEAQGRHRYYRLVDERAGRVFEALASLAPLRPVRTLRQSRITAELSFARTCYDHLAGALAVAVTDGLVRCGAIVAADGCYQLGAAGAATFEALGVPLDAVVRARRSFAHPCLDWSERRHHLAGALGAALLGALTERGWVSRRPTSRAVTLHASGRDMLSSILGCAVPDRQSP
ncbi:MAG: winged helix-turn-helix domain-containing protein [Actinomycetota bacterium]|nr:winged helix-turn-helix domain-containing protein [Actinomycetota bacterium]